MAEPSEQRTFSLDQFLPQMRDLLDVPNMYVYLIAMECLTHEERNQLEVYHKDQSQLVCKLVEFIKKRGTNGVEAFLKALAQSVDDGVNPGHGDLLQSMEAARRRKLSRGRQFSTSSSVSDPAQKELTSRLLETMAEEAEPDLQHEPPTSHPMAPEVEPDLAKQAQEKPERNRDEAHTSFVLQQSLIKVHVEIPPYSWKPFLAGMGCSALIAAGIALFVYAVRGFEEDEEDCEIGASYSFSAFTFMAAFLCLTLPILLILVLLYQFVKEHRPVIATRCMKYVSIKLAWVGLGLYVLVLIGQIIYSVYIAVFAYGDFKDWKDDKVNCTDATFIAAFTSLTALYILLFFVLLVLSWLLVRQLRKYAFVQVIFNNLALPLFSSPSNG